MASSSTQHKSREDFRRANELEEARKAGLAPAERDEDGNEINPHIPQFMSSAPWYLNQTAPSLKHQKKWTADKRDQLNKWFKRGKDTKGFQALKFRKGACANCGAMGHGTKDCLERPRSKGAKWTEAHIKADDVVEAVDLDQFDAKRDRWNGYDPSDFARVVTQFEKREQMREEVIKEQEMERVYAEAAPSEAAPEGVAPATADEDKIEDEEDATFGELKKRVRTAGGGSTGSVRDLRIREDTAKYLLNLDARSAHYDPKSRSMREDPNPHKPDAEKSFRGDNALKRDGDYSAWMAMTSHSLTAAAKGQSIHMQGAPSQAEALQQRFLQRKAQLEVKKSGAVLEQYGNAAAEAPDASLMLPSSEAYVEYNRSGRVIRGVERRVASRYQEDALTNNHTCVWGSWWKDGVWGYACCHATLKNSYCTGAAGAGGGAAAAAAQMAANVVAKEATAAAVRDWEAAREAGDEGAAGSSSSSDEEGAGKGAKPDVWGEAGDVGELDETKLAEALRREEALAAGAAGVETDDRKRKYNALDAGGEADATAEEMEAYRLKKTRAFDGTEQGGGTSGYDMV